MILLVELQNLWLPLFLFTLIATGTPGPNNALLTLSGSQFGLRKTIPFLLGIRFGIGCLFVLMAIGVGAIVETSPGLHYFFKLLGASYLAYLSYKIAFKPSRADQGSRARQLGFKDGALFQFINPKVMMTVLTCTTAYSLSGEYYLISVIQAFIVFSLVGTVTNTCWVLFGVAINQLLSTTKSRLIFNRTLALVTLCSISLLFY